MGTAYSERLRDPRWQRKRFEILTRDKWTCRGCRDKDHNLQVHHKRYERGKMPWEYDNSLLLTLCETCHTRVTALTDKAAALLSDFNLYELPIAIKMLERIWTESAPDPMQLTLERLEMEKAALIALPYSSSASQQVERIDELADKMWSYLAPVS